MEGHVNHIVEELTRGEILLYLRKIYPEGATSTTLQHYLEERAYPVDGGKFDFHVRYLAEANFVTFELFHRELGRPERIRLVKITRAGIDEVEGRPKSSSGVRF